MLSSSVSVCQYRRGRFGDICSCDVVESGGSDRLVRRWVVTDDKWLSTGVVVDDDDELHDARDDPVMPIHIKVSTTILSSSSSSFSSYTGTGFYSHDALTISQECQS